ESALPTRFSYSSEMPTSPMQYWEYELSIWESDDEMHNLRCGCFTGPGRLKNTDLGIEAFFENNDRILDYFFSATETGQLNELVSILADAEQLLDRDSLALGDGGASINLYGYVFASEQWVRNVCEEYILIIHLDEKGKGTLGIGRQQSERYQIKVPT